MYTLREFKMTHCHNINTVSKRLLTQRFKIIKPLVKFRDRSRQKLSLFICKNIFYP